MVGRDLLLPWSMKFFIGELCPPLLTIPLPRESHGCWKMFRGISITHRIISNLMETQRRFEGKFRTAASICPESKSEAEMGVVSGGSAEVC